MNKKLIAATVLTLAIIIVSGIVMFAHPKITKEKKDFYDKKILAQNTENEEIGKEMLMVAKLPDGAEKEQKLKELEEREIKYKKETFEINKQAEQDGYVSDKDVLDNNAKLIKKLESLKKMYECDIKNAIDNECAEYDTQQLNKVKKLLEEVKQSDESKFTNLRDDFNEMIRDFKEDRPKFEKQYKEKHEVK